MATIVLNEKARRVVAPPPEPPPIPMPVTGDWLPLEVGKQYISRAKRIVKIHTYHTPAWVFGCFTDAPQMSFIWEKATGRLLGQTESYVLHPMTLIGPQWRWWKEEQAFLAGKPLEWRYADAPASQLNKWGKWEGQDAAKAIPTFNFHKTYGPRTDLLWRIKEI